MSPEQALGKSLDARTDLWSWAVLFYQCLTGRPPFQGSSSIGILHAITTESLPPVREVRADVPELADHIVMRALEKDCDLRYQRASDVETDLKRRGRRMERCCITSGGMRSGWRGVTEARCGGF
jgi:serine/threonine protein kinase